MSFFEARYPGRCAGCPEPIRVGDPIEWEDDQIVHADCAVTDPLPAADPKKLCGNCFMEHAGECL